MLARNSTATLTSSHRTPFPAAGIWGALSRLSRAVPKVYENGGTAIDFRREWNGKFRAAVSFRSNCWRGLAPTGTDGVFIADNARMRPSLEVTMPGGVRWLLYLRLVCATDGGLGCN